MCLGLAARDQQGAALQQYKRGVIHSVQGFQPRNRGERLVSFAIEYEQMRQCPQDAGISRRKLCCDKQVRGTPLCLPMTPVEIAQDMQKMHRVVLVGQVSIPSCIRPSRSR